MTLKVMICFGTRPEAIKLAPVVRTLAADPRFKLTLCSTGHYREMLRQVLDIFGMAPDCSLDLMRERQTVGDVTAVVTAVSALFEAERPDRILVQDDTTNAFAVPVAAFYARVRVGHVEAALRTRDLSAPFPEEFNRRVIHILMDILERGPRWRRNAIAGEALAGHSVESHRRHGNRRPAVRARAPRRGFYGDGCASDGFATRCWPAKCGATCPSYEDTPGA